MAGSSGSAALPVIDVGPLVGGAPAAARAAVAEQIQVACRERGFFYLTGHGVPGGLLDELADASTDLFRIFHYPPSLPQASGWGVGEHTDYGLVTLLAQDDSGGLQVAARAGRLRRSTETRKGGRLNVPPGARRPVLVDIDPVR